jgi:hypothetical protein
MSEGIAVEPIHVRFAKAPALVGESSSTLYEAVRNGELDLIKDERGRSFLIYEQLKERCAARKRVKKAQEKPHLAAARDAYHARRKQRARGARTKAIRAKK